MYMNSIMASVIEKVRIPIVLPDELSVIKACVATSWEAEEEKVCLSIIRSTLHLDNILVSASLVKDIEGKKNAKDIGISKIYFFSFFDDLIKSVI